MRERYSWRNSIWRWPIIVALPAPAACCSWLDVFRRGRQCILHLRRFASKRLCGALPQIGLDVVAGEPPIVVEIGDHVFHERLRQRDGAFAVAGMLEQNRQRQLLRAGSLISPFETALGELPDVVVRRQRRAVDGDDKSVHGAPALVGFHFRTGTSVTGRW